MPILAVDNLTFDFPAGWDVEKYDDWDFHVNGFQNFCGGSKAMDIVALEKRDCCWLIEAKDYRVNCQTNAADLAEVVAKKARDTLAGLATARIRASAQNEKQHADDAVKCANVRIVLHMENPPASSPLFATAINPANVVQQLKQLAKAVDPNPLVVDIQRMQGLGWAVQ